jgi:hypothetical protein
MSWSITVNGVQDYDQFPPEVIEQMITQHIAYPSDMMKALQLAKDCGFKSAVLTGMRTPNPYGGDEVVDISVRGMLEATDFQSEMKKILKAGPNA